MSDRSNKPLVLLPGPVLGGSPSPPAQERRSTPRFSFTAAAEIFEIGSQGRVTGRTSDLSPNGCYIDTMSPYAAGIAVRVRMKHGLHEFEAIAAVRYSLLSMGMGLEFTEISPENQAVLQRWLAESRGEPSPGAEALISVPEISTAPAVGNLRQVLNELISLLIRKKIITENEGTALLRQMFQ
jgi:hypothetical protein